MFEPVVAAIWGDDKSGKTSCAFSFPKPIRHFDLDVGGYKRAVHRFSKEVTAGEFFSKPYYVPQQSLIEKMAGKMGSEFKAKLLATPKSNAKLIGMKELWYEFITDYINVLSDNELAPNGKPYRTVIFDSFVQAWELCRLAFLQEKQDRDPKRESLLQIEYGEPNARMRALVYASREQGKNLVLTHYAEEAREDRLIDGSIKSIIVGDKMAGWKYTEKEVDVVIRTKVVKSKVLIGQVAKMEAAGEVVLCGLALELTGMTFPLNRELYSGPSWEEISQVLGMYRLG